MNQWVDIRFDCLPLRSVARTDIPMDASPKYQALVRRIVEALEKHGSHNSYYLHNARCDFHLTNDDTLGRITFGFEGALLTDPDDQKTLRSDLSVKLISENCDWLSEPIVQWFCQTVPHAVRVEFDRYIRAGDLDKAKQRVSEIEAASDDAGGFMGMYL